VLNHVNALLSKALVKMEDEFQKQLSQRRFASRHHFGTAHEDHLTPFPLLTDCSKPMEPDRLFDCLPSTLRPSSESQPEGGRNPPDENQEAAVYITPALIEPKFVPLLAKLAQQLVQAGCQQQCSEIYRYTWSYTENFTSVSLFACKFVLVLPRAASILLV
jgi:exocyst complex component 7